MSIEKIERGRVGMKAIHRKPSGFSDPRFYESEVEIVGYCYGGHEDARGYNQSGETALAIFVQDGRLDYAPVRQFLLSEREGQE